MNQNEYLAIFTKHLQVAEPKRHDLVAELESHLLEDGTHLGDPVGIAQRLNRVHIGLGWPWWSPIMVGAIWTVSYLLLSILFSSIGGDYQNIATSNVTASIWFLREVLGIISPIFLAMYYGRLMTRQFRPQRIFITLLGSAMAVAYITALITTAEVGGSNMSQYVVSSLFISIMMVLWFGIICIAAALFSIPFHAPKRMNRWDITILVGGYILSLFLGYMFISIITDMILVPFDGWLTEQRPTSGSFLLAINNFFEPGVSMAAVHGAYIAGISLIVIRRFKYLSKAGA